MAKGNNGHLLQHGVEVAAALHLSALRPEGRLHIALTHGMAPFEPCGKPSPGTACRLFQAALDAAEEPPEPDEPALVTAYRATNASLDHYPNTGELLRSVIGTDRLAGGITECDPRKHAQLQHAWSGSSITPVMSSWRAGIGPGGVLTPPASLDVPWLFTMDPMTYSERGEADDNNLHRADLERLSAVLSSYVASGEPGVAALFVYSVHPEDRPQFWTFVDDLARRTRMAVESCWLTHQGGNRNLAAVLCSAFALAAGWLPAGLNAGR